MAGAEAIPAAAIPAVDTRVEAAIPAVVTPAVAMVETVPAKVTSTARRF